MQQQQQQQQPPAGFGQQGLGSQGPFAFGGFGQAAQPPAFGGGSGQAAPQGGTGFQPNAFSRQPPVPPFGTQQQRQSSPARPNSAFGLPAAPGASNAFGGFGASQPLGAGGVSGGGGASAFSGRPTTSQGSLAPTGFGAPSASFPPPQQQLAAGIFGAGAFGSSLAAPPGQGAPPPFGAARGAFGQPAAPGAGSSAVGFGGGPAKFGRGGVFARQDQATAPFAAPAAPAAGGSAGGSVFGQRQPAASPPAAAAAFGSAGVQAQGGGGGAAANAVRAPGGASRIVGMDPGAQAAMQAALQQAPAFVGSGGGGIQNQQASPPPLPPRRASPQSLPAATLGATAAAAAAAGSGGAGQQMVAARQQQQRQVVRAIAPAANAAQSAGNSNGRGSGGGDEKQEQLALQDATVFNGLLEAMCAADEIADRVNTNRVSALEKPAPGHVKPDGTPWALEEMCVREYRRLAAGKKLDVPKDVRTVAWLRRTHDYLLANVMSIRRYVPGARDNDPRMENAAAAKEEPNALLVSFLQNRLRQIFQEYRMQGFNAEVGRLDSVQDLHILEHMARWHIDVDFRMRDSDAAALQRIDAQLSSENYEKLQGKQIRDSLTGMMKTLRELYLVGIARRVGADRHVAITSPYEDEMAAYFVLRDLPSSLHDTGNEQNGTDLLLALPPRRPGARESPWVLLARFVIVAYRERRWAQFFAAVRAAPYLARCLLFQVVPEMRELALLRISRGGTTRYELGALARELCCRDEGEARALCVEYGLEVADDGMVVFTDNGLATGKKTPIEERALGKQPVPDATFVEQAKGTLSAVEVALGRATFTLEAEAWLRARMESWRDVAPASPAQPAAAAAAGAAALAPGPGAPPAGSAAAGQQAPPRRQQGAPAKRDYVAIMRAALNNTLPADGAAGAAQQQRRAAGGAANGAQPADDTGGEDGRQRAAIDRAREAARARLAAAEQRKKDEAAAAAAAAAQRRADEDAKRQAQLEAERKAKADADAMREAEQAVQARRDKEAEDRRQAEAAAAAAAKRDRQQREAADRQRAKDIEAKRAREEAEAKRAQAARAAEVRAAADRQQQRGAAEAQRQRQEQQQTQRAAEAAANTAAAAAAAVAYQQQAAAAARRAQLAAAYPEAERRFVLRLRAFASLHLREWRAAAQRESAQRSQREAQERSEKSRAALAAADLSAAKRRKRQLEPPPAHLQRLERAAPRFGFGELPPRPPAEPQPTAAQLAARAAHALDVPALMARAAPPQAVRTGDAEQAAEALRLNARAAPAAFWKLALAFTEAAEESEAGRMLVALLGGDDAARLSYYEGGGCYALSRRGAARACVAALPCDRDAAPQAVADAAAGASALVFAATPLVDAQRRHWVWDGAHAALERVLAGVVAAPLPLRQLPVLVVLPRLEDGGYPPFTEEGVKEGLRMAKLVEKYGGAIAFEGVLLDTCDAAAAAAALREKLEALTEHMLPVPTVVRVSLHDVAERWCAVALRARLFAEPALGPGDAIAAVNAALDDLAYSALGDADTQPLPGYPPAEFAQRGAFPNALAVDGCGGGALPAGWASPDAAARARAALAALRLPDWALEPGGGGDLRAIERYLQRAAGVGAAATVAELRAELAACVGGSAVPWARVIAAALAARIAAAADRARDADVAADACAATALTFVLTRRVAERLRGEAYDPTVPHDLAELARMAAAGPPQTARAAAAAAAAAAAQRRVQEAAAAATAAAAAAEAAEAAALQQPAPSSLLPDPLAAEKAALREDLRLYKMATLDHKATGRWPMYTKLIGRPVETPQQAGAFGGGGGSFGSSGAGGYGGALGNVSSSSGGGGFSSGGGFGSSGTGGALGDVSGAGAAPSYTSSGAQDGEDLWFLRALLTAGVQRAIGSRSAATPSRIDSCGGACVTLPGGSGATVALTPRTHTLREVVC
ncbi:hypothetical protein JKP88DRAFT_354125 [Tribonema minus]|uniref:SAC3/GANP/THP3 conserved domain-containing protein n=1 Tax=Tribonema minus TaxID=303371 RepID=A0A836CJA8_9STRA|nr:hypothetical protein JKP88DRAFT_354125 [Tribonema minus]